MADGGIQLDATTGALAGSIGTALLAWLGNRLVGKAAIQTAINAAFKESMDQMRLDLRDERAENARLQTETLRLLAEIRQKDAIIAGFERTTVMPHGRDPG